MKETDTFLKNTSLKSLLNAIKTSESPIVREALKCMKAEKMFFNNPKMDEQLRVIKDYKLNFIGFKPYDESIYNFLEKNNEIVTRAYAEFNSDYRQLVTNVLVHTKTKNGADLFGFLEKADSVDNTIFGSVSMVGGHCNIDDNNLFQGLIREVSEELRNVAFLHSQIYPLGFIREMGDNISRQHLCVLYAIDVQCGDINISSNELNEKFIWVDLNQIKKELASETCKFDSWAVKGLNYYLSKNGLL